MFTGIITECGQVNFRESRADTQRMGIRPARTPLNDFSLGESVAVLGACLTVAEITDSELIFELSPETLQKTNLGQAHLMVNLERALRPTDRISGHLVSGHIDTTGRVLEIASDPSGFHQLTLAIPKSMDRYVVSKGSLCIDGVSLTINSERDGILKFQIIPHTWKETCFKHLTTGSVVNIEFDLISKHLEKLCQPYLKPLNA